MIPSPGHRSSRRRPSASTRYKGVDWTFIRLIVVGRIAEERAAVDSELGAPESGWQGEESRIVDARADLRSNGRAQRDKLLPALHAVQNRIGWISHGALNYVASRLDIAPAEVYGVASFYGMFSLQPRPPVVAHVCDDIACFTRGSSQLCVSNWSEKFGSAGSKCNEGRATWVRSQCLGLCERAPAALIVSAGDSPQQQVLAPASAEAINRPSAKSRQEKQLTSQILSADRPVFRSLLRRRLTLHISTYHSFTCSSESALALREI